VGELHRNRIFNVELMSMANYTEHVYDTVSRKNGPTVLPE